MTQSRTRAVAAALLLAAGGCGVGTYNPPPGGARAAGPAKPPPPDAPRAFVFAPPAKAPPAAAPVDPAADPALPVGQQCVVHFQRAQSGSPREAAAAALSPVSGVLDRVTREWLIVKGPTQTYWVPRGDVLRIDVGPAQH